MTKVAAPADRTPPGPSSQAIKLVSSEQTAEIDEPNAAAEETLEGEPAASEGALLDVQTPDNVAEIQKLNLVQVIDSVHRAYPLVESAYLNNQIAAGNLTASEGEFDTKLKASSENGPTGFYQTYRNKAGVTQPLQNGGEVFGGYRIGRGDFQPWYQERQTNDGGEFKVGARVPFVRDRDIDARRAEVWRANYDQQIAQPEIRTQLIMFGRDAALTYWKWVSEGRKYLAERDWLELAESRNKQVSRRVDEGDLGPPELTDNKRAIAKRKSKLADQLRKVRQAAVKLSLYLRDANGTPVVVTTEQIPEFPQPDRIDPAQIESDIAIAINQRPDLKVWQLTRERLRVDYDEATNLGLPRLDGSVSASQDVGVPTSKKRDKSEFELEVGVFFDMPLQRRKALGKARAIEAKMAQVALKERFTRDKIVAGVRSAVAGLEQAYTQVKEASEAVKLANEIADIERRKFELGESDLLKVALREQYAIEAIEGEVSALLNYFTAYTEYLTEMAYDRPVPISAGTDASIRPDDN